MVEELREAIRTGDQGDVIEERVVGRERGGCILGLVSRTAGWKAVVGVGIQ